MTSSSMPRWALCECCLLLRSLLCWGVHTKGVMDGGCAPSPPADPCPSACCTRAAWATRTSSSPTGRRPSTRSTRWACTRTCSAAFTHTVRVLCVYVCVHPVCPPSMVVKGIGGLCACGGSAGGARVRSHQRPQLPTTVLSSMQARSTRQGMSSSSSPRQEQRRVGSAKGCLEGHGRCVFPCPIPQPSSLHGKTPIPPRT